MVKTLRAPRKPEIAARSANEPLHVVFTGGGTGGHLFPGLAVADELRKLVGQVRITFVGRGTAFERAEVTKAGYEFLAIAARPLPRRPWQAVGFLANHLARKREARRFLRNSSVSLVVGLGGYASVPVARAASTLGIPLVLLEQNAVAGRANRWLASSASLVCSAFELARPLRCTCPVHVIGNPVRQGFTAATAPQSKTDRPLRLVVLGGSQGARVLNEQVPRALYKVGASAAGWEIIHQSGQRDAEATSALYVKLGLKGSVKPFLHNLPAVLEETDLVISRAGGTTLAELAAARVPALLIPYPTATNDHQRKNADRLVEAGAAQMIDVRELDGRLDNRIAELLRPLLTIDGLRQQMSAAMQSIARPTAAADAAKLICELLPHRATGPAS